MNTITGIYQIYNQANDKQYIGQSINVEARFASHKSRLRKGNHRNLHLQRVYQKYGENALSFYLIEECDLSELDTKEQWYLDHTPNLYNQSPTSGKSSRGIKRSAETREKLRQAGLGRHHTEATRAKMRLARLGHFWTDEMKQRASASKKGIAVVPEGTFLGRRHTEESKHKMSVAVRASWKRRRGEKT